MLTKFRRSSNRCLNKNSPQLLLSLFVFLHAFSAQAADPQNDMPDPMGSSKPVPVAEDSIPANSAASSQASRLAAAAAACRNAEAYAASGNWSAAIKLLEKVLAEDEHNEVAHNDLAIACFRTGEFKRADYEVSRAIQLNPRYSAAYLQLGVIKAKMGDLTGSEKAYLKAAALDPSSQQVKTGSLSSNLDTIRGASGSNINSQSREYFAAGRTLLNQGKASAAKDSFSAAIRADARNVDAYKSLSLILTWEGFLDDALVAAKQASLLSPRDEQSFLNLGFIASQRGKWTDSLSAYSRAKQIAPSDLEACVGILICDANLNKVETARASLKILAERNPRSAWPHIGLAEVLANTEQYSFAIDQLKQAFQCDPDNFRAKQEMASISFKAASASGKSEDWKICATNCRDLLKVSTLDVRCYVRLGLALFHSQDYLAAKSVLNTALSISPHNASAHSAMSGVLAAQGLSFQAMEEARAALHQDPNQKMARSVISHLGKSSD